MPLSANKYSPAELSMNRKLNAYLTYNGILNLVAIRSSKPDL